MDSTFRARISGAALRVHDAAGSLSLGLGVYPRLDGFEGQRGKVWDLGFRVSAGFLQKPEVVS